MIPDKLIIEKLAEQYDSFYLYEEKKILEGMQTLQSHFPCRYVTKVIDRKLSQGKTFIILKNTMNGFVRPSLARLVAHYSTETSPAGSEPFFSGADAFQFIALKEGKCNEYVTLAGNLCTATDVIAENILMPHLEYGDLVVVSNAGAYAAVLSPMQFSLQERPAELFVTKDGKVL